jgi:platelet-activating factor acetylhydrolase IB subunit alpha
MNARGGSNLKENVLENKWMTLSKLSKKVSDLEK